MNAASSEQRPRSFLLLPFSVMAGWAVCFWPAKLLRPEEGVFWMSVAAGCCLLCGMIVILVPLVVRAQNDLAIFLIQMMIRFGSLVGVALYVRSYWPRLGVLDFFGWLILFYLLTLLLEVRFFQPSPRKNKETVQTHTILLPDQDDK